MKHPCKDAHGFADGELAPAAFEAFAQHLGRCRTCPSELELIFAFKGLAEAMPPERSAARQTAPAQRSGRSGFGLPQRLQGWLLGVVFGTGAALAGAVTLVPRLAERGSEPEIQGGIQAGWPIGPTRRLEARLSDPRVDIHRPFDELRSGADGRGPTDYARLGELQKRGDVKGLVSHFLVSKEAASARALLAVHAADPSLDNERAVLALLEHQPAQALVAAERALAHAPRPAAQWNRALALRDLGLGQSAAEAFAQVAAAGESGWRDEALAWVDRLRADVRRRRSEYNQLRAQLDRLERTWTSPAAETYARWPELVRKSFHEALRRAPGAAVAASLADLAQALDQPGGDGALGREIRRVSALDFAARSPLQARYRALAERRFKEAAPGELRALAAVLRRSGDLGRDLLLGLVLADPAAASDPGEPQRLARPGGDRWLAIAALEAAAALEKDTLPSGKRERTLRAGLGAATAAGFTVLRLSLEQSLVNLLLRQLRSVEAGALARRSYQTAQSIGVWPLELAGLALIGNVASFQQDVAGTVATTHELDLGDEPCGPARMRAHARLAERLTYTGDLAGARRALAPMLGCGANVEPRLSQLTALSELARTSGDRDGVDAQVFARELARFRAFRAQQPSGPPTEALYAEAMEGRVRLAHDRIAGRRLLAAVIARTEQAPSDKAELAGPRIFAYRRLINEAVTAGEPERGLALMAAEREVELPRGCVLGISEELRKATIVARFTDASGDRFLARTDRESTPLAPERVVPSDIAAALSACPTVAVIAESPFRGRGRLLPPEIAWHHVANKPAGPTHVWRPRRHVAVADITLARGSAVAQLPPWQEPQGGRIDRILRGPAATPHEALLELARADLIEFHVHGIPDFSLSDAPHLVLSEGANGESRLWAHDVRRLSLTHRPYVVLAACDSARNSPMVPSYSGRLGLPAAFLDAGARGVLAADRALPDRAGAAFIGEIIAALQRGQSGAVALRNARVAWLARGDADWVKDLLVFE